MMSHICTKVMLRQQAISKGRISLYLDYYPAVRHPETMQMNRREYLGIYIYASPKNELERAFNGEMLAKAEAIRCIRVQALINEDFGFLDRNKMRENFLAYFLKKCRKKEQKWRIAYMHFSNYVQGRCTFGDLTVDLCQGFAEYLLKAKKLRREGRACCYL